MKKLIYGALAFSPLLAFADVNKAVDSATQLATGFSKIMNILIPAFFALAVVYFFYGMAKYILAAGDPDEAKKGKSIMIYGVIGLAVMASLYGLINFLTSSVGVTPSTTIDLPSIPTRTN